MLANVVLDDRCVEVQTLVQALDELHAFLDHDGHVLDLLHNPPKFFLHVMLDGVIGIDCLHASAQDLIVLLVGELVVFHVVHNVFDSSELRVHPFSVQGGGRCWDPCPEIPPDPF